MALTQEQKNTISNISQNPKKVLEFLKHAPYYLNSFKNEFFQDGTGIISQTLYQYLLTEDSLFLDLYVHIINNSTLTAFDKKGHKLNALDFLLNFKTSVNNFSYKIFKILENTDISNIGSNPYLIENNISELYNEGFKDFALLSIHKYHSFLSSYKNLLISVVKNDDIVFFKNLLINPLPKKNFNNINFHKEFKNDSPYKNILYFALENKSKEIASLLLNDFPELSSNEKSSGNYSANKKIPLLLTIENYSLLLEPTINSMSNEVIHSNFNHITNNSERVLTYILNNNYSNFIEKRLNKLLQSDLLSYQKSNFLKAIFESKISYENKFSFLETLLNHTNPTTDYLVVFNSFIYSIQKNPNIKQDLFDKFIEEFKKANLILEDSVFNTIYFHNVDYFKIINNNNILSKINPLGFFTPNTSANSNYTLTDDHDYIWYKISQLNFKNLSANGKHENALHLMLAYNLDRYVNFFNEENLNLLLSKNFQISSYRKFKDSKDFYEVVLKLVQGNFKFNEDSNRFLKLLSFNAPENLLDTIIKNNNISISHLSNEKTFWNYINNQNTFDYCISHNATLYNAEHLLSLVYNNELLPLELYLKNNGNINYTNEYGNILHSLCKDSIITKTEEIILLLDYFPELAVETNKQNKFPVSYLMNDFNKLCKRKKFNGSSYSFQLLEKYYKVIKSMFQCGLHSKNKKAFNILESQLLKYTDINTLFPDLIPILRAEKLSKKLEIKGIKVKNLKI